MNQELCLATPKPSVRQCFKKWFFWGRSTTTTTMPGQRDSRIDAINATEESARSDSTQDPSNKPTAPDMSGQDSGGPNVQDVACSPSMLKNSVKSAWHGVRLTSKNVEKCLDGTPFKIPFAALNSLIDIVDAVIENKELLAILLLPIVQRLEIVSDNLVKGYPADVDPTCERFSKVLTEAVDTLRGMSSQGIFKRVLEANEHPKQLDDIFRRVNEATKNFELELMLATVRQTERINQHAEILRLTNLLPSREVTYAGVEREPCIEGTRQEILDRVMDWCKDTSPESPSVYWLNGMAGTGKSTIAYTLCQQLYGVEDAARRLGASFFCSRQVEAGRMRRNVIRTIAHELAHNFPAFGRALLDSKFDVQPPPLKDHIHSLLVTPWSASIVSDHSFPPLVVVVDALDELERGDGSAFLEELIDEIAKRKDAVRGLKFFITSRKDPRIVRVCKAISSKVICQLEEVDATVVEDDINLYLHTKLPSLDNAKLRLLACQASGLFIYAATAVRFIIPPSQSEKPTIKAQEKRLDMLLTTWPNQSQCGIDGLLVDHIYEDILYTWIFPRAEVDQHVALSVLQTIVCTEEPVLISDIPVLLNDPEMEVEQVTNLILSLHAVLYVSEARAYSYHKSFVDFVFDRTRFANEQLAIMICPTPERHFLLTMSCFHIMEFLRFNICDLPSSFLDDSEIEDLPRRIDDNIPSALRYACRHWAKHVSKMSPNKREMRERAVVAFRGWLKKRLLFWMEVMNLFKVMGECYYSLVMAREAIKTTITDDEMNDLAAAENLATIFGSNATANSTPHLYISALAALSHSSSLMSSWHLRFPGIPTVSSSLNQNIPILSLQHYKSELVHSVSFTKDGTHIISGGSKSTRVWNSSTGQQLRQRNANPTTTTSVSPDLTRVISGINWIPRSMRVYDLSTGEGLCQLNCGAVWSVCFSPNGTRIVSGAIDCTVRVWDASTGHQLRCMHHDSPEYELSPAPDGMYMGPPLVPAEVGVMATCFSPDGEYIVSGGTDKTVRIWVVETSQQLHRLPHNSVVDAVTFSPDGTMIGTGSRDSKVRTWDVLTGNELQQLDAHKGSVTSISFSSDGKHLVSGSKDGTMCIWDISSGMMSHRLNVGGGEVLSVGFSPDGTRIVSGSHDNFVRVWNMQMEHQFSDRLLSPFMLGAFISLDSTYVLSGSSNGAICLWDFSTGKLIEQLLEYPKTNAHSLSFSPDGRYIAFGHWDDICIWDTLTRREFRQLDKNNTMAYAVNFSPDSNYIVSSREHTICVWEVSTGKQIHSMVGHMAGVDSVSFSTDGTRIISGSGDQTARIWDMATGKQLHQLDGHTSWLNSVGFSSDGYYAVSGSQDRTVCTWDVSTGQQLQQLEHEIPVLAVAFSPDGKRIVSGLQNGDICIWDVLLGQQLRRLDGHSGGVRSISFSPDGVYIMSASSDGSVRIWNSSKAFQLEGKSGTDQSLDDGPHHNHQAGSSSNGLIEGNWSQGMNGWITSSHEERYIWISPAMRRVLQRPDCLVLSHEGYVKVDLVNANLGTEWKHCYDSTVLS